MVCKTLIFFPFSLNFSSYHSEQRPGQYKSSRKNMSMAKNLLLVFVCKRMYEACSLKYFILYLFPPLPKTIIRVTIKGATISISLAQP